MSVNWNPPFNINVSTILNEFVETNRAGGQNFGRFMLNRELASLLESCLEFGEDLPIELRPLIVTEALRQKAVDGKDAVLAAVQKKVNEYADSESSEFVLITPISIGWFQNATIGCTDGLDVKLLQNGNDYPIPDDVMSRIQSAFRDLRLPTMSTRLAVKMESKSVYEAAHRAMEETSLTLGIVNWILNLGWGQSFSMGISTERPKNRVTSGPYFTLHKATGEFEQFWYDPTYIRPPKAFKLEAKWQHVIEQKSEIESILPNHTYRDVLLTAFRKYQHAMGLSSDEASIVSLWALLEFLTCSEGKHNDTVRRTAFLYTDELPRLILERIRHSRNRYVHHAEQIEDKQNIHY